MLFLQQQACSARDQFLILEEGDQEEYLCLSCYQTTPQRFWSANGLILVTWPKLSTVVIAGTSCPILTFCWVSGSQSLLPQSGKTLDFLFRPCF